MSFLYSLSVSLAYFLCLSYSLFVSLTLFVSPALCISRSYSCLISVCLPFSHSFSVCLTLLLAHCSSLCLKLRGEIDVVVFLCRGRWSPCRSMPTLRKTSKMHLTPITLWKIPPWYVLNKQFLTLMTGNLSCHVYPHSCFFL